MLYALSEISLVRLITLFQLPGLDLQRVMCLIGA